MSQNTSCDKCKKQKDENQHNWLSLSLHGGATEAVTRSSWIQKDYCYECSNEIILDITKVL